VEEIVSTIEDSFGRSADESLGLELLAIRSGDLLGQIALAADYDGFDAGHSESNGCL
jgi:hypothetical protein